MRTRPLVPPAIAAAVVLAAAALLRPASGPAAARETLRGRVTAVYDGDTIRVDLGGRTDERVRLIGVDSPELDDARERVRMMAFLAKRFAFSKLYQARVELLPGPEERDNYGRLLAFLRTESGEIFNETLVGEGFAFAYLKFPFDEAWKKRLKDAEDAARRSGKGLWRTEPYPVVEAADAGGRVGRVVTVRFRCLRSFKRGGYRILEADGAAFDAVIPLEALKAFPGSLDFAGRTLEATGLVELYKDRPQVQVGVPAQLTRVDRRETPP